MSVSDHMDVLVREWVETSSRVLILTGAGISTGSGIPDFRGPQGVWTKNPHAEKMSNIQYYMSDPEVRQAAWQSRLVHPAFAAKPNKAHLAIAQFEGTGRLLGLITQNIDGLHQVAGSASEVVIEVHGTIHMVVCMQCGRLTAMQDELERVRGGELDPSCSNCQGILKSNTISFGQALDENKINKAMRLASNCDLLLCIGSTLQVYPIAGVVDIAKAHGSRLVIVNNEGTKYDSIADAVLRDDITAMVPYILADKP